MRSREELLSSIGSDMRLTMDFFKRIYGYELTWPGFAEIALSKLEEAGCSRAREYYMQFVSGYETKRNEEMKEVAKWLLKNDPYENVQKVKNRPLTVMSNNELLKYAMSLLRDTT